MNKCRLSLSRYLLPVLMITCWTTATTPHAAQAATLMVDADGHASATNCNASTDTFTTIQAAVNAAAPGDTISVCPGVYSEQLVVPSSRGNLTIRGFGAGSTVLRPTAVLQNTTAIFSGAPVRPIVLVDGAPNVTFESLTIDGSAADSGSAVFPRCPIVGFYIGVYFRAGSGTINTTHITWWTVTATRASAVLGRVPSA